MKNLTKLALAAVAAGVMFTAGSVATSTEAEARHGIYRHGGYGFGVGRIYGHRFGIYRPWGYRYGIYRPFAYRPWVYRPRVVVVGGGYCFLSRRINPYTGYSYLVRVCR